ncbi:MAG TPA: hypothetical protein VFT56_14175 [Sphingomonas sp.]|nr:hypothetical protein [Sphingomonas sp.]
MDLVIRALGCVLLGVCAITAWWLYRSVHRPPAHPADAGELTEGALAVLSWAGGWAALGEGQGLFQRIAVPAAAASPVPHHRAEENHRD